MTTQTDHTGAVWAPSPNYSPATTPGWERLPLRAIILHGTAGFLPGCLDWLRRANGDSSSHYLVGRAGTVYQLVREADSAWANGAVSAGCIYPASPNINRYTLSIETEQDANNGLAYTPAQLAAVIDLIRDMRRRHGPLPLIPHSAIDPVNRHFCPGPRIDLAAIDRAATVTAPVTPPAAVSTVPTPAAPRVFPDVYLQRDSRWTNQRLGTVDGITLGAYGCYVTSLAMVAGSYGHHITPAALDDVLTNRNVYANGDMMPDDALARVYPDLRLERVYEWSGVPADLGVLARLARDPALAVVLGLDFDADPTDGIQTHFVTMQTCDGRAVWIDDPWYGNGRHPDNFSVHYGDPRITIQKAVVYRGPVGANAALVSLPTSGDKSQADGAMLEAQAAARAALNRTQTAARAAAHPLAPGLTMMTNDDWLKSEPHIKGKALAHLRRGMAVLRSGKTTQADGYTFRFVQWRDTYGWVVDKNVVA